jgi:hypothetical protein
MYWRLVQQIDINASEGSAALIFRAENNSTLMMGGSRSSATLAPIY